MNAASIKIEHLTKDYGAGRGIFDLNLEVAHGEVLGFLGANGAGKTVTMRTLMGFIKPTSGSARINGLDCFRDRATIQSSLGYLPGEALCPGDMKAIDFIDFIARMKATGNRTTAAEILSDADRIAHRFELDTSARIRSMSKGTKQKVSIACAFMGTPDILLLDEPTSGLDPIMQDRFIDLVIEHRDRGATILLSSHIFSEIERACDRVAFIREGCLHSIKSMRELRERRRKVLQATFSSPEEAGEFMARVPEKHRATRVPHEPRRVDVEVTGDLPELLQALGSRDIVDLGSRTQTIEELFHTIYQEKEGLK